MTASALMSMILCFTPDWIDWGLPLSPLLLVYCRDCCGAGSFSVLDGVQSLADCPVVFMTDDTYPPPCLDGETDSVCDP